MHELLDEAIGASPPSRIDLGSVITMARRQATKRWIIGAGATAVVLAAGAAVVALNLPHPASPTADAAATQSPTPTASTAGPSVTHSAPGPLPTSNCAPAGSPLIPKVTGRTFDVAIGEAVPGVKVELGDCTGATREVWSDSDGNFAFWWSSDAPIAAGDIVLRVTKDPYLVVDYWVYYTMSHTDITLAMIQDVPSIDRSVG